MAYLKETGEWVEGVYQIEEDDPVMGGADGVDNRPHKELAARTTFLKGEVEKVGEGLDKHNTNIVAHTSGIAGNAATATKLKPTLNGSRNQCWLLCKLPKSATALVHYKILGAQYYDQYSTLEVVVKNGFGWCKYVGRSTEYQVSIKAYDSDTTIDVYLFVPGYCDYWEVFLQKNGAVSEFSYIKMGDATYVPSGTLVIDTATGQGCGGVELFNGKQILNVNHNSNASAHADLLTIFAKLTSPAFTGTPTAPTADATTNNTQIATTAFVKAAATAANCGGIVGGSLAQNGWVKFANGLILQWGSRSSDADGVARLYFPISFTAIYNIVGIHTGGDTAIVSEISQYHGLGSTALWVKQSNGGVGTFGLNWIAVGI